MIGSTISSAASVGMIERRSIVLCGSIAWLRDSLVRDEAVYVGAQLPPLLRGLYYDGWHPGARRATRSRTAFLERVHDDVHRDGGVDAEEVVRAVFAFTSGALACGGGRRRQSRNARVPAPMAKLRPRSAPCADGLPRPAIETDRSS